MLTQLEHQPLSTRELERLYSHYQQATRVQRERLVENLRLFLQPLQSTEEARQCLVRPIGQIDRQAIVDEKANIDQIVATLGLKEMTQGTLIRKLFTYTAPNPTRRAIFEFDKLIRSLYTLRDPQMQRNVHRSQNRIESYHQLRAAIAQVGGKKEFTGRTDIETEISNQCARLIANTIIYCNSAILSRLLTKYEASRNVKALALITKFSPAAWRHVHLNGHYTFRRSSDDAGLGGTLEIEHQGLQHARQFGERTGLLPPLLSMAARVGPDAQIVRRARIRSLVNSGTQTSSISLRGLCMPAILHACCPYPRGNSR